MPLYHYVMPITIFDASRAAKYGEEVIKMPTKRWDTLAWFQITSHKGDFEKSLNLGQIKGGFGIPSTASAKATPSHPKSVDSDSPATVRKQSVKRHDLDGPIAGMPAFLTEYMQLNATKSNLATTIAESSAEDNVTNTIIMDAINIRRAELADLLKRKN